LRTPQKPLLTALVWISPLALLAACGSASSSSARTSSTPHIGSAPPAVGPATARDLSAVRQAAAHTLTLHAAVSIEFASRPSVPYPPIKATGAFDLQGASGQEIVHDAVGAETLIYLPTRIFDRRPPSERAGLPEDRPWIKVDLNEHHLKTSPFAAELLLSLEQHDPGFLLAEVAWRARDAAPLGPSTVNGIRVDGYLVHVDAARAAAAASGPGARAFVRLAALVRQELGGRLAAPQVIRLWVDRSDRVVSLRTSTLTFAAQSGGGTTLMTLTSFGTPVRLSPPALSQTVDLATLGGTENDGD